MRIGRREQSLMLGMGLVISGIVYCSSTVVVSQDAAPVVAAERPPEPAQKDPSRPEPPANPFALPEDRDTPSTPTPFNPFGGGGEADPFQEKPAEDKPTPRDPFGGNADPFGGGSDPFGGDADKKVRSRQTTRREQALHAAVLTPEQIEPVLEQTVSVTFKDTPLTDVMQFLEDLAVVPSQKELGKVEVVPFELNRQALEDIGFSVDSPVTLSVDKVSLHAALTLMLTPLDLAYVVQDGSIQITTIEDAETSLVTRAYPMGKLLARPDGKPDYDSMIRLVTRVVEPNSWSEVGGPGEIDAAPGALVISQPHPVHRSLDLLFKHLESLRSDEEPQVSGEVRYIESPATTRLRKALDTVVPTSFYEIPLEEVAEFLGTESGIPIVFNQTALDEFGISPDVPIISERSQATLRDALTHLLRPLDLTWSFENEVLMITTEEHAEYAPGIRVYPIADLVDMKGSSRDSIEHLREMVTSVVVPESWDEVGGHATVMAWSSPPALVIAQTEMGHEAVALLLKELRRAKAAQMQTQAQAESKKEVDPNAPKERRVYWIQMSLDDGDADRLRRLIAQNIHPASWNEQDSLLEQVADRWIVRARPHVLEEIEELLQDLKLWSPPSPNANFPGGTPFGGLNGMEDGGGGFF